MLVLAFSSDGSPSVPFHLGRSSLFGREWKCDGVTSEEDAYPRHFLLWDDLLAEPFSDNFGFGVRGRTRGRDGIGSRRHFGAAYRHTERRRRRSEEHTSELQSL